MTTKTYHIEWRYGYEAWLAGSTSTPRQGHGLYKGVDADEARAALAQHLEGVFASFYPEMLEYLFVTEVIGFYALSRAEVVVTLSHMSPDELQTLLEDAGVRLGVLSLERV